MNNLSSTKLLTILRNSGIKRGTVFGGILVLALLAFEVFNYSTTDFALTDLLGSNLTFIGLRWATILSIAFCGIDFAGLARLFTPQIEGSQEPAEVWYLFGAWLLAAGMNATLTWWGVSIAVSSHTALGTSIIGRDILMRGVPVFVAVMVWLIRLLIIGTISMSGERLFQMPAARPMNRPFQSRTDGTNRPLNQNVNMAPKPFQKPQPQNTPQREPTYQPAALAAKTRDEVTGAWR
jgi:hypothetical protein